MKLAIIRNHVRAADRKLALCLFFADDMAIVVYMFGVQEIYKHERRAAKNMAYYWTGWVMMMWTGRKNVCAEKSCFCRDSIRIVTICL